MKELAEVVAVDGNRVTVTTQLKTACSGCAQVSTCGAGILSKVFADRNAQFHVVTDESVTVGDRVELDVPEQAVTQFALMLYGLPILALLIVAIELQSSEAVHEGITILLSFAGFALTFLGLRAWFRRRDIKINQLVRIKTV